MKTFFEVGPLPQREFFPVRFERLFAFTLLVFLGLWPTIRFLFHWTKTTALYCPPVLFFRPLNGVGFYPSLESLRSSTPYTAMRHACGTNLSFTATDFYPPFFFLFGWFFPLPRYSFREVGFRRSSGLTASRFRITVTRVFGGFTLSFRFYLFSASAHFFCRSQYFFSPRFVKYRESSMLLFFSSPFTCFARGSSFHLTSISFVSPR